MAGRLAADLPPGGADHALILNNLGAVPPIEMGVVAHEVLRSALGARVRLVLGPGPFMTALNMNGFSLSLLRLDAGARGGAQRAGRAAGLARHAGAGAGHHAAAAARRADPRAPAERRTRRSRRRSVRPATG